MTSRALLFGGLAFALSGLVFERGSRERRSDAVAVLFLVDVFDASRSTAALPTPMFPFFRRSGAGDEPPKLAKISCGDGEEGAFALGASSSGATADGLVADDPAV